MAGGGTWHLSRRVVRRGAHMPVLAQVAPAGRARRGGDADAVGRRAVAVVAVAVVLVAADITHVVADPRGVAVGRDETLARRVARPVAVVVAVERVAAARRDVARLGGWVVSVSGTARQRPTRLMRCRMPRGTGRRPADRCPTGSRRRASRCLGTRARSISTRSSTRCSGSCPGSSLRGR